jgi:WD40 repeat protein
MNKFVSLVWGAIASLVLTGCGGSSSSPPPRAASPPPAAITPSALSISPTLVTLKPGEWTKFWAGTGNTAVNWTVQEGAAGGSIDSGGTYTAPLNNGTFHVVATSQANPGQSGMTTVTVAGTFAVAVYPSGDVLGPLGVRAFTANVPATWSVQEGAAGGAITTDGVYTAPSAAGLFHVVATSVQVPGENTVAQVTVVSSGFRPTGAMGTARTAHTATVLKDGRVLVTGGGSCFYSMGPVCPLDSVEIYDPSVGKFSATGKMSVTRVYHTATLLNNGQVLVTGGYSASADLYDPASGRFAATEGMSVSRTYHTATLLADGKVLIAGGESTNGVVASAELYDPATGTFTTTGTMTMARSAHTATLLANGKVLLAGGWNGTGGATSTAELYDPATGSFTRTGSMAGPREYHAAAPLGNSGVLVAGGDSGHWTSLSSAEVYDVATGKFTITGSMMIARAPIFLIPFVNGKVLVSGNYDFTAELYDTASGSFTQTGSMAEGRWDTAAVLLQDGRILVTGGSDISSAELYQ